ncbi:MAG: hypothetical protein IT236_15150 [Bacteroidia bacterium]|nr:hypothetical protein [Bacteroidia bacterium]
MDTHTKEEHNDVYLDLMYFKETKESINELLHFRRNNAFNSKINEEKIKEIKSRALVALDNLFAEDCELGSR